MEYITTSSFLAPAPTTSSSTPTTSPTTSTGGINEGELELEEAKQLVLPPWFTSFFTRAVWSVIGLNSITLLSAGANVFLFPEGLLGKKRYYYAGGLAAALAHYAFVPLIAPSVEALLRMCAAQSQEKGKERGGEKEGGVKEGGVKEGGVKEGGVKEGGVKEGGVKEGRRVRKVMG
ncbi:hypothetical protein N0V83_002376 [Neocucurbitaria cava]|uniref:Uncharacterized protein n=1 Tax=Neocucurbitaria cava TaxID=798079 RepID=A0A9W9CPZ9_9PLEO|nr:hypothetical protein N0V83_002376 [Neocucurbitaria cava]